ncbi:MAG: hypothetical protein V8Q79_03875 [Christensenellales bacterium]
MARRYSPVIRGGKACDVSLSIGGDAYCSRRRGMTVINNRLADAGRPIVLWGFSVDPRKAGGRLPARFEAV